MELGENLSIWNLITLLKNHLQIKVFPPLFYKVANEAVYKNVYNKSVIIASERWILHNNNWIRETSI